MDEQAKLREAVAHCRVISVAGAWTLTMTEIEAIAAVCAAAEATLPKAVEPEPRDIYWAVQEIHDFNASGGMPASVRTALRILVERVKGGRPAPAWREVPCWEVRATAIGNSRALSVVVHDSEEAAVHAAAAYAPLRGWTCVEVRQSTHRVPA